MPLSERALTTLRHTFAAEALAAGIGTFALARYMGTSVEMIEKTYGHLAVGSEEHARQLLSARGQNRYGQELATGEGGS